MERYFPAHNGAPIARSYLDDTIALTEHIYAGDAIIEDKLTLRDEAGQVADAEDTELQVSVSGNAELAGLGSGDPKPTHGYAENVTRTFHGRALAILRRTGAGEIVLTAETGTGLDAALRLT